MGTTSGSAVKKPRAPPNSRRHATWLRLLFAFLKVGESYWDVSPTECYHGGLKTRSTGFVARPT